VWGSSSSDVYASGCGVLIHSTGAGIWTQQTASAASNITGFWGSSSGDVYGASYSALVHSTGGGNWSTVALPAGHPWHLQAGTSFGANDAWAVGTQPTPGCASCSGVAALLHLSGGVWTEVPIPSLFGPGGLNKIWGVSDSDLYIGGYSGGGAVVYHQGATFTQQRGLGSIIGQVRSIWGSATDDVYVVTDPQMGGQPMLHSRGDGTWTPLVLDPMQAPAAIWGSGPRDVYVITTDITPNGGYHILHGR
jgi:hypothetical protein